MANQGEDNQYYPPASAQLSTKTFECFTCKDRGFPGVSIYLKGKDERGYPVRIELDKVTAHRHRGQPKQGGGGQTYQQQPAGITATATQSQLSQTQGESQTKASYEVAQALNKIQQMLETLPAIANKLDLLSNYYGDLLDHERETSKRLDQIAKVLIHEQDMADAEATYDQEKEEGFA